MHWKSEPASGTGVAGAGTDDVVGRVDISHPIAHRLVHRILERLVALGLALNYERKTKGRRPHVLPQMRYQEHRRAKFCVACGNPLPAVAAETAPLRQNR